MKCTLIEIHLLTPQGLQPWLDVPIYSRIAKIELFRPHGEAQDLLFISFDTSTFCVLQWDSNASKLVTRAMADVANPLNDCQIGIIDPDCKLIGLNIKKGVITVIPWHNEGQPTELNTSLKELTVLDIKFLYGCSKPTIAVLYQNIDNTRRVKTYEISLTDEDFVEGSLSENNLDSGANLLIPVPPPLCGVIIVGKQKIVYINILVLKTIPIESSITRAYGRVDADGSRYLLGDHMGLLHLLVITHIEERVTGLKFELLGETSIASTISYLDNGFIYVGSSSGDSQLIKLNLQPDAQGSYVEVVERYANLGPIADFCVVNPGGQSEALDTYIVTCSGAYKDSSLRLAGNVMEINEQVSVELQGIKGMWSMRKKTDDVHDTFLVISFICETRILEMCAEDELVESEIEGFKLGVQTVLCHNALNNQLVQVTSSSVLLFSVSSSELRSEWKAPEGSSINVAAANATQVLVAVGGGYLIYLEIKDEILIEAGRQKLECDISCLDVTPIGKNTIHSDLAVAGMWDEISVRVYSLPYLRLLTTEKIGGEIIPRCVLLCSFETISYLLCALGDGQLLSFILNTSTGELTDRKRVTLGTRPVNLRTFSSKKATYVFAASDGPIVIYSSNKELRYSYVTLKEASHVCPFHSAAFPDCLAMAVGDKFVVASIDVIQKYCIRSIREHARSICHQQETRTFAICSLKYNQASAKVSEMHFVHLLDDQTLVILSTYALDLHECGCSILSCSFEDDINLYYCVGTAYDLPDECEPTKGRILIFVVEDGKLKLIAEKQTVGAVYSLNAFNGKLLAAVNQKIQLYKWMLRSDGTHKLQYECRYHGDILYMYVKTRGDFIIVGDLMMSISLLIYKRKENAIEECAKNPVWEWMSCVEILNDDVFLGAAITVLFTLRPIRDGTTVRLDRVGSYNVGEAINCFRHGSFAMQSPDSEIAQIPTVIFGTETGRIGLIASLPNDQYLFLEELQSNLRKVVKGVGGLSYEKWRSHAFDAAENFLDGDLIESFLDLNEARMEEVSASMGVSAEHIYNRVKELTKLHQC